MKVSDVQLKSSNSTMWRQNIILLLAAFLTTTYGRHTNIFVHLKLRWP